MEDLGLPQWYVHVINIKFMALRLSDQNYSIHVVIHLFSISFNQITKNQRINHNDREIVKELLCV